MIAVTQGSSSGIEAAVCVEFDLPTHCVYLLVSKAKTGALAGTFKLGNSDRLAGRHREHVRNWEEFDLVRSALVRVSRRREAQHLEKTLRQQFSNPEAEAKAKAEGRTLSSADFEAIGSDRRYPGRQAGGWTEFFAIECMERMLATAEYLLGCTGRRAADAVVQRGIILPAHKVAAKRQNHLPKRAHNTLPAYVRERWIEQEREERARAERVGPKTAQLLDFLVEREAHVVWVDLSWWHHLLRHGGFRSSQGRALMDVYFGGFAPSSARSEGGSADSPLTRTYFAERAASIVDWARLPLPDDWKREPPGAVCCWEETPNFYGEPPPHFACLGKPRIRLDHWPFDRCMPYLERFDALGGRVANRYRCEQMDLLSPDA